LANRYIFFSSVKDPIVTLDILIFERRTFEFSGKQGIRWACLKYRTSELTMIFR